MTTLQSQGNPTTSAAQTANEPAQRSYANATKKQTSGPAVVSSNGPAPGQSHGKSNSISPVNGKSGITPAVPAVSGPTIVNSSAGVNGTSDHSRKPSSVTIPNGSATGPSSRPNISFGSMNAGGSSPAVVHSTPARSQASLATPAQNPRVTSPANSPTPIPSVSSGGPPPSGLQGGNNAPVFGMMAADGAGEHNARPISMPPGPAQHLRRESSQSAHSDINSTPMNRNFSNGGRGRGSYPAGHAPGAVNFSPGPSFRQLSNNQRGPNMPGAPFQNQGPLGPSPNSPYRGARSPAITPAVMQQQMQYANNPSMQHGYPPHPQYLQSQQGMYGVPGYDPNAYYNYGQPYMHPSMQYPGAPPSPRPNPYTPQQPYMQAQYPAPHSQGMSRSSSQVPDRPPSAAQPQTPSMTAATHVQTTPSHTSGSPAPNSSTFTIPNRTKSKGIVIKNADGEVVTFDKKAASPAPPPASGGPVVVSTPTPPPRVPSTAGSHGRTESTSVKTAEEKKLEFQEKIRMQLDAEKEEAKKKKDDEERQAKATADAKAAKEKEEAEKAAKAKEEADRAEKERLEAEKAKEAEEKAKKDAEEKKRLEEEEFERMIAEMEAKEKEDEEREKAFQEKKKLQAEEAKKKEAEAAAKADEEMRRLEREAEEAEEAKAKKAAAGESSKDDEEARKLFAKLRKPTFGPGATDSGASTPTSESMPPPAQPPQPRSATGKPKPAALKLETSKPVEPAQPTAGMQSLKTSRFLAVQSELNIYPAGIKSPNPALNTQKNNGRQYDKDFLLQFRDVFKEKPSVDWDFRLKETVGDGSESARPQSARTPSMGRNPSSRGSLPGAGLGGVMGNFGAGSDGRTLPRGTTSHERFMASQQGSRGPTMSNPLAQFANRPGGFSMGGAPAMGRNPSYQSMPQPNSPRTGSTRGKGSRRGDGNRAPSKREEEAAAKAMPLTAGQDLKPLEVSTSGWKPTSIGKPAAAAAVPSGHMAPDLVQRKVKAALNKMTPENFDKIADQILQIAAQSKDEADGRTLRQVIQLTFEKACDEAHWASMYAKFCKRMLETMSQEIKDDNVRDKNGNPVVGGALFRKYLLNRCQEDFERGWEVSLPEKPEGENEAAAMLSDEYYIAAAAKRKGLGLIQFIGELYKLGMLTLRIMHECVLRLLNFEGLPDESAIESLVKLLRTIGATMESAEQGPSLLNTYFDRINKISNMEGLPSRLKFMLMDVVDLRRAGWKSKDDSKGPKTIQEIRDEAAAAQQAAEAERQRTKQSGGGRPPLGRGDARSASGAGMVPPPDYNRSQIGMDDLRKLTKGAAGRTTSQGPGGFGPSSLFNAGRSSSGRRGLGPSLGKTGDESGASSRTGTPPVKEKEPAHHQNSFSALAALDNADGNDETIASPPSTAGSPPVNKTQPARSTSPAKDGDNAGA